MRDWKDWFKKAGIRAIKTIAQAFVAMIGTATYLGAVDWKMVLSASALAGIISRYEFGRYSRSESEKRRRC